MRPYILVKTIMLGANPNRTNAEKESMMYTLAFVAVVFLVSGASGFLTARNIYKRMQK